MDKTCCFFGHRTVNNRVDLQEKVSQQVEELIKNGFSIFLFGGFGEFDELCYSVVSQKQKIYSNIKRVYCVSDERHLNPRKRPKYLQEDCYEEFIYYAPSFDYWYKRIYYRNCEMIDRSDYIIFYAENRKDSGAYKTLKYAIRCKIEYTNLFSI